MDILELADKIINGKRLCREDNTDFFASCDLENYVRGPIEFVNIIWVTEWICVR